MPYQRVRIDLVDPETRCYFCARHRRLASGIAQILVGDDGREHFAGPTCGPRNAVNPRAPVPDYTRGAPDPPPPADEPEGDPEDVEAVAEGDHRGHGNGDANDDRRAAEYLSLRCRGLAHHPGMRSRELDRLFATRGARELSDSDVARVVNVMREAERGKPRLTLRNLHDCYAYDRWLEHGLQSLGGGHPKARFIRSFLDQLRNWSALSVRQLETAHGILGKLRFRAPRRNAFGWKHAAG